MLSPRDTQIARLIGRGFSPTEVASRLKLNRRVIYQCMKQDAAQAMADRIRNQLEPTALDVLHELLSDPSSQVRLQAARTLLTAQVSEDEEDDGDDPRAIIHVHRPAS